MKFLTLVILIYPDSDSAVWRTVALWIGLLPCGMFLLNKVLLLMFNFEIQNQIKLAAAANEDQSSLMKHSSVHRSENKVTPLIVGTTVQFLNFKLLLLYILIHLESQNLFFIHL